MPAKRKLQDVDSNSNSTAPAKRQRVSRACDQCRSAREKCDGIQPQCFSCVTLNRECTYKITPKKRGVQTGLIRTLELALVWLFDQFPSTEAALADLLTQERSSSNSSKDKSILFAKESHVANRLHKRWRRCKVHQEIDRVLSGKEGTSPRPDNSGDDDDDSGTEIDVGKSRVVAADVDRGPNGSPLPSPTEDSTTRGPFNAGIQQDVPLNSQWYGQRNLSARSWTAEGLTMRRFRLPNNHQRLLDGYLAYTHCWLPILDPERLRTLASSYPLDGLDLDPEDASSGPHAELWCALAVGSLHDAAYSKAWSGSDVQDVNDLPQRIYTTARSLISLESGEMMLDHVKALLVLSLVKLGQDKPSAASFLIGLAVRGILQLGLTDTSTDNSPSAHRVVIASVILDTIVSLRLGQTPHMRTNLLDDISVVEQGSEEWAPWSPPPGLESEDTAMAATPSQTLSSFNQLYKFFQVLNRSMEAGEQPQVGAAQLVQALDQRFSFCNSVVFGGATIPTIPPAFLLQATFLSATLALLPDPRVSLVWTLMEAMENYISHFGVHGTSPLLVVYMGIANNQGCIKSLRPDDRMRWNALMNNLQSVWQSQDSAVSKPSESPISTIRDDAQPPQQTQNQAEQTPIPFLPQEHQHHPFFAHPGTYQPSGSTFLRAASATSPSTARSMPYTPNSQLDVMSGGFMGAMATPQARYLLAHGQAIDYDAILDELASIDCTDSMEADPQFMANLGFAPGSAELADMLRGDFGAV